MKALVHFVLSATLLATTALPAQEIPFSPPLQLEGIASAPRDIVCADLNGDGAVDLLCASEDNDRISWFENLHPAPGFSPQQIISTQAHGAAAVCAADLDGDGLRDALAAAPHASLIAWYRNLGDAFGEEQPISTVMQEAQGVEAADLDGDGDLDVIYSSFTDSLVFWREQLSPGVFGLEHLVSSTLPLPLRTQAVDLDGDGDLDIAAVGYGGMSLAWFENTDSLGGFTGLPFWITDEPRGAKDLCVTDLDGDGDADIATASARDDRIAWFENTDGLGSFGVMQVLDSLSLEAGSIAAADLDGDGWTDLVTAARYGDRVAWHRKLPEGGFEPARVLCDTLEGARRLDCADLDNDGDVDIAVAALDGWFWFRNQSEEPGLREGNSAAWPEAPILRRIAPNPFNPATRIDFTLPRAGEVRLDLFSLRGSLVLSVYDGLLPAGEHSVPLRLYDRAGGLYLLRLATESGSDCRKVLYLR